MKYLFEKINLAACTGLLMIVVCGNAIAVDAGSPQTAIVGSNVVTTWQESNEGTFVSATVGTVSSPLGPIVSLSDGITGSANHSVPTLFTNSNGDALVVWDYLDVGSNNYQLASAFLPAGGTGANWVFTTLSDSADNAAFDDTVVSMDGSGNIMVSFTNYDSLEAQVQVKGVTGAISSGVPTFNASFLIAP